jgi:hypothetical protein
MNSFELFFALALRLALIWAFLSLLWLALPYLHKSTINLLLKHFSPLLCLGLWYIHTYVLYLSFFALALSRLIYRPTCILCVVFKQHGWAVAYSTDSCRGINTNNYLFLRMYPRSYIFVSRSVRFRVSQVTGTKDPSLSLMLTGETVPGFTMTLASGGRDSPVMCPGAPQVRAGGRKSVPRWSRVILPSTSPLLWLYWIMFGLCFWGHF